MAKPLTEQLFQAIMMDEWPGFAACVDFGLDGWGDVQSRQYRYEALYYPIRAKEITIDQLDEAIGDGPKLTALVNRCKKNPHKGIVFQTAYDELGEEE